MSRNTFSHPGVNTEFSGSSANWRESEYLEVEDLETVEAAQRLTIRLTDDADLTYTPRHFQLLQHSPGDRLGTMATIGTVQVEPEFTAFGMTLPRSYRVTDPVYGIGRNAFPVLDQLDGKHRYVRIEGNA